MRVLAAAVVSVGLAASAVADDEVPTPPKPARIHAQLDGDTARFAVRYRELRDGALGGHDAYELPMRGLITAATAMVGGERHLLPLADAKQATEAFELLWTKMPGPSRRWAVLIDTQPHTSVFSIQTAVPHKTTFEFDLQIAAPTCFYADARYVSVPTTWSARLPATMHVPKQFLEEIDANCAWRDHEMRDDITWVKFAARELAARASGAERIGTYAGRTVVGKANFVKLELNLAARISDVPRDLVTAIVVDASRSMRPEDFEAQRETIAAYLRATPNGRVQLIEYARHARAVLPSWTTGSQASARVDRELRALQRKNGSNIVEGLREAGRWLDHTTGTRRILLFTDEALASRAEHTRIIDDAVPARTLVHVIALGGEGFVRDDDAKLARIAAKTKGMSVRGGEPFAQHDETPPTKLDAMLLARPITLDHVRVETPGWERIFDDNACPESKDDAVTTFPEGSACTWWGRGTAVASPFVVEGFLWGEHVRRVVRADLDRALDVVRELSAMHILDEELQLLAERAARAVNRVWSLFGTWGGDDGYADRSGIGGIGWGSICGGCSGDPTGTGSGFGTFGARPDLELALSTIVKLCKPAQPLALAVETTFEEIVDIEITGGSQPTRTCVEEALWNAWLVAPGAPPQMTTVFFVKPA